MIHILDAYSLLNQSVLKVCEELTPLTQYVEETRVAPPRLREQTYSITEEQRNRVSAVVTAHNLGEYTNRFYGVQLTESITVWLDYLIEVGRRNE